MFAIKVDTFVCQMLFLFFFLISVKLHVEDFDGKLLCDVIYVH